jgi:peptide/nickel transport system permease protein
VLTYILRRLLWMIPTLIGVSLLTFGLIHLAPGDPSSFLDSGMQSGQATAGDNQLAALEKFRARYLLDQPLWKQYLHYVGPFHLGDEGHAFFGGNGEDPWNGLLSGDLGTYFSRPDRVAPELWERLKVTVPLAGLSILLSYLIAVPLGIFSALRRGTTLDAGATVLLFVLYAIPTFWAGLMLQLLCGKVGFDFLPVIGLHGRDAAELSRGAYIWDLLKHLILPVICYSYASFAYLSRQMRVGMLESIEQDYIRTARAKGLSERAVVLRHALRNSLLPILTLLASILPVLIGGSIIVEVVFDIPGMGKLAYEALTLREYDVIMATTLFSALMTVFGILLSDLAYALVDPRIRYA